MVSSRSPKVIVPSKNGRGEDEGGRRRGGRRRGGRGRGRRRRREGRRSGGRGVILNTWSLLFSSYMWFSTVAISVFVYRDYGCK